MVSDFSLRYLAQESARLNSLTDSINDLVLKVEKDIYNANPGFAFFGRALPFEKVRMKDIDIIYRIGWCRYSTNKDERSRWQLVLAGESKNDAWDELGIDEPHTNQQSIFVVNSFSGCNKEMRLLIYEHLDQFVYDFVKEITYKAKDIEDLRDGKIEIIDPSDRELEEIIGATHNNLNSETSP